MNLSVGLLAIPSHLVKINITEPARRRWFAHDSSCVRFEAEEKEPTCVLQTWAVSIISMTSASPDCGSGSTNVKFGRLVFVDLQLEGSWRLSFPAFITYFSKESTELQTVVNPVFLVHVFY